ncbi:hypothetical protein M0R45_029801 [Rubus argutus]|uniref:Uncharacterized protein n=1 Tax=Rubus argutus TaxID=59490 RepID=A0AAW1WCQ5_RUBAR
MGCVSSKLFKKDLREEVIITHGPQCLNHVVSLTSSTYGLLNLNKDPPIVAETKQSSPKKEDPEVINAWELMEGSKKQYPLRG